MAETSHIAKYPTRNSLPLTTREAMIQLLNQALADVSDLYTQTKQAHWNVKGMHFIALHELFDTLAESVEGFSDLIAERVTVLGGYAMGTARMAAAHSRLPEFPADLSGSEAFVSALVERYASFANAVRAAIETASAVGDQDTADLFTEVSREMDKHLWFLEAHLTN
jgi:starvation-inducible DNA-binding protein